MNISMTLTADKAADFEKLALVFSALADSSCAPGVKSGDSAKALAAPTTSKVAAPLSSGNVAEKQTLAPAAVETEGKTLSLEDVRKASKAKIDEGKQDQVKETLEKFGANRLTALEKADYSAFMAELDKL
ncbi:hypothetical protein [Chitinophaga rhizosphaerae]|uniref:hypothetical protein n=1 Tax=Chitinophaga rhizosphaerae TaxID=1864947 RepID=UPI0013DFBE08|nr:hypothetical protein [Chitinophaga rhizosphaerae]